MTRRFSLARWGGATEDGNDDVDGCSLYIQIGPFVIELCWGKVRK
jgi:hypothetical protein